MPWLSCGRVFGLAGELLAAHVGQWPEGSNRRIAEDTRIGRSTVNRQLESVTGAVGDLVGVAPPG
jgi:hypothetical protein